ncbi:MAG: hypothetical protein AAFV53_19150 [Myxococcota bacterium]
MAPLWTNIPTARRTLQVDALRFSIRESEIPTGAGPNRWSADPRQVWVDAQNRLHLRLAPDTHGIWRSVEVFAEVPLLTQLDFSLYLAEGDLQVGAVASVFLYRNDGCELDFELSRWGEAGAPIAQYAIAPADSPKRRVRFALDPTAPSHHRLNWHDRQVQWQSWQDGVMLKAWYAHGWRVPRFHAHRLHINLWLLHGTPPPDGQPIELIVSALKINDL